MGLHRDAQKRFYVPGSIYFITTNTYQKYPYFENEILCELFWETLDFSVLIKCFNLHGLAINPDHLHLIIEPTGKYNYSEIMGALKRNFAWDCNALISGRSFRRDGEVREHGKNQLGHVTRRYMGIRENPYFKTHLEKLTELQVRFLADCVGSIEIPFRWQSSFRDHLVKTEQDYQNHLQYILKQPLKHQLPGRNWYWIAEEGER